MDAALTVTSGNVRQVYTVSATAQDMTLTLPLNGPVTLSSDRALQLDRIEVSTQSAVDVLGA